MDAAWLNNLLNTEKVINIPEGEVLIDGPINRLEVGQELLGAGSDKTIFKVVDDVSGAVITDVSPNAKNVVIRGIGYTWPNMSYDRAPDTFKIAPTIRVGKGSVNTIVDDIRIWRAVWGIHCYGTDITISNYRGMPLYRGLILMGASRVKVEGLDLTDVWYPSGSFVEGWQRENGHGIQIGSSEGCSIMLSGVSDKYGQQIAVGTEGTWW